MLDYHRHLHCNHAPSPGPHTNHNLSQSTELLLPSAYLMLLPRYTYSLMPLPAHSNTQCLCHALL